MTYAQQSNFCCSAIEIGTFFGKVTAKDILKAIEEYISDTHGSYDNFTDKFKLEHDLPQFFYATTTKTQVDAAKALKEVGFKERKVCGRHAKTRRDKYLSFWILDDFPAELKPWIRKHRKKRED